MEIKLVSKTEKGKLALKKMFNERHSRKNLFFKINTFVVEKEPYTLKIVWSGKAIDLLEKTQSGREQMIVGIRPLVPKYGCTDKDIEII